MKIFKLFVCIALILSISLINSFAAISVSDGSAFVTKAEFAADLNNLSNRMSTLENSLDAKIDSLVSSYLSRNGIWNGEKHTSSASSFNNSNTDRTVVAEFNKSGLLMLPYEIDIDYKVGIVGTTNMGNKSEDSILKAYASPVYHAITTNVVFTETNTDLSYKSAYFYGLTGEFDNVNNERYRMVLTMTPAYTQLMFVTKGNGLKVKMETTVNISMDWWAIKLAFADKENYKSESGTEAYNSKGTNPLVIKYLPNSAMNIRFKTAESLYVY